MATVKSIKRNKYKGKVYDISVKDDHTYTIEDCIVHNSGAGSLVNYCLGITQVDPLKYGLLFERFLDASRLDEIVRLGGKVTGDSYPDIDIDFSDRDAVKEYLVQKYGINNTCSIGTIGRMKNKSVLIELTRSEGIPQNEIHEVTTGEMKDFGKDEEDWTVEQLKENAPTLKAFLERYPKIENNFLKLRGLISFWGKHAGGVLVSDESLADQLPVRVVSDKVVSCWVEGTVDRELGRMGFIKMDILGIETLNQIQMTLDLIKKNRNINLNMYNLPLDDKRAMKMCNNADTTGVFQFESYLTDKVVSAMGGIKVFEDYSTASALMRPSALTAKLHEKFGRRRSGEEEYTVPECLQESLGLTYGLTVYQESAYHVAKNLCGFSIVEAYKFMKLLYKGKMNSDELVEYWREKFYKGAKPKVENGDVTQKYVEDIFEDLLKFQGYGFCASHSISYAMFSAWQLHLKAHYFQEFVCCLLMRTPRTKENKRGQSLLEMRVKYARRHGMKILPPHINKSKESFSLQDGGIRFGLGGLKGISTASEEIVKNRPYVDFSDFMGKVNTRIIHKGRMENLIYAGCFDCFCKDEDVYGYREEIFNYYHRMQKSKDNTEQQFLDFFQDVVENDDNYRVFSEDELKQKEVEMMGMELQEDIKQKYALILKEDDKLKTIEEVKEKGLKYPKVLCAVKSVYSFTSKKGVEYCKVQLTDGIYEAGVLMSKSKYDSRKKYFEKRNVLALPVVVADGKDYDYFLNEKEDIKILE